MNFNTISEVQSRVNGLYVWNQINGKPIIAGRFDFSNRIGTFYYANSYIDNPDAVAIDPVNLPLISEKEFHTKANGGIFGALLDAGPDRWGQRVLAELSTSRPRNSLEFLLAGNGDGCGTLLFSLSQSSIKIPSLRGSSSDVNVLEKAAQDLLHDEDISPEIKAMLRERSSLGGARPKASITIENKHYLAKFNRDDDLFNEARAEMASLSMAHDAGINVSETKVIFNPATQHDVMLTKRFDFNEDETKRHYVSANSIMNMHKMKEGDPDSGYPGLTSLIRQFCAKPKQASVEMFRRMSFRVLLGDTDDHAKNHGFLYNGKDNTWDHSPMFDVLPHVNLIGSQAMTIGAYGRESTIKNLLSMTESFALNKTEALQILKENIAVISNWRDYYREAGVSENEITIIEPCFHLVDKDNLALSL